MVKSYTMYKYYRDTLNVLKSYLEIKVYDKIIFFTNSYYKNLKTFSNTLIFKGIINLLPKALLETIISIILLFYLIFDNSSINLELFGIPRQAKLISKSSRVTNTDLVSVLLDYNKNRKSNIHINRVSNCKKKIVTIFTKKNLFIWDDDKLFKLDKKTNLFNLYFLMAKILHSQKRLHEAKITLIKAVRLNPSFFQLHLSLGSILKDLGDLKAAEKSTRKAIELNPNYANSYSNLGGILKDIGELNAAEKSTRKAIELDSDFAEAHLNLGGILKELNKLKEAESSTRIAINLKPNYAIGYLNLGSILSELGKLEEAELAMNKVNSINPNLIKNYLNQGNNYQLKEDIDRSINSYNTCLLLASDNLGVAIEARVHLAVNNLILGNYNNVKENIIEFQKLINIGALEKIECKTNRKHVSARANYLQNLFPLLVNNEKNNLSSTIIHFGESHSLSFSQQVIKISSNKYKIKPSIINGGKAWHFANMQNNKFKSSLKIKMKKNIKANKIFISFGEIDCRKDEGILSYSLKYNKDIFEVCKRTVTGYINYMESNLSKDHSQRYYFGVPAPVLLSSQIDDIDLKRKDLIILFNDLMKKEILSRDCFFIDNYTLTANDMGWNNNKYMCDNFHLSPKSLPILFEKYLYKSNT